MAKTRVQKNFVLEWQGPRGGVKIKKFFTKEGRDAEAKTLKAAGTKGVKTRQQTLKKVGVKG